MYVASIVNLLNCSKKYCIFVSGQDSEISVCFYVVVRERLKKGCFRKVETNTYARSCAQGKEVNARHEYRTSAVILQIVNKNGFLEERLALPCHNLITSQE